MGLRTWELSLAGRLFRPRDGLSCRPVLAWSGGFDEGDTPLELGPDFVDFGAEILERVLGVLIDDGAGVFLDGSGGSEDMMFVYQGDGLCVGEHIPVWVDDLLTGGGGSRS
jgi:hypothetical protein